MERLCDYSLTRGSFCFRILTTRVTSLFAIPAVEADGGSFEVAGSAGGWVEAVLVGVVAEAAAAAVAVVVVVAGGVGVTEVGLSFVHMSATHCAHGKAAWSVENTHIKKYWPIRENYLPIPECVSFKIHFLGGSLSFYSYIVCTLQRTVEIFLPAVPQVCRGQKTALRTGCDSECPTIQQPLEAGSIVRRLYSEIEMKHLFPWKHLWYFMNMFSSSACVKLRTVPTYIQFWATCFVLLPDADLTLPIPLYLFHAWFMPAFNVSPYHIYLSPQVDVYFMS